MIDLEVTEKFSCFFICERRTIRKTKIYNTYTLMIKSEAFIGNELMYYNRRCPNINNKIFYLTINGVLKILHNIFWTKFASEWFYCCFDNVFKWSFIQIIFQLGYPFDCNLFNTIFLCNFVAYTYANHTHYYWLLIFALD